MASAARSTSQEARSVSLSIRFSAEATVGSVRQRRGTTTSNQASAPPSSMPSMPRSFFSPRGRRPALRSRGLLLISTFVKSRWPASPITSPTWSLANTYTCSPSRTIIVGPATGLNERPQAAEAMRRVTNTLNCGSALSLSAHHRTERERKQGARVPAVAHLHTPGPPHTRSSVVCCPPSRSEATCGATPTSTAT
jgi:hypothetical protein